MIISNRASYYSKKFWKYRSRGDCRWYIAWQMGIWTMNNENPFCQRVHIWKYILFVLYIFRFKEIKKEFGPKCCWVNSNWYNNILFKNNVTNRVTKHLFSEKRYSIDNSLFSKLSSSITLRNSIGRCFRKFNAFSDFRFEGKVDNFSNNF